MNKNLEIFEISHTELFNTAVEIFYDLSFNDTIPVRDNMFLFEPLTDPNKFIDAVTNGFMGATYFCTITNDYENKKIGDNAVVVVMKNNKPWVSVLVSMMQW